MAKTVSFGGSDWDVEQQGIDQRKALAAALMKQGMTMPQGTEMVSGIAVAQNPLAGLARMLTGYIGKQELDAADTQAKELQGRKAQAMGEWLKTMPRAQQVTEQQLSGDRPGAGTFSEVTRTQQPALQDYLDWSAQGALMGPQAQQIGATGLNLAMAQQQREDQREFQASQAEEGRKQRIVELQMRAADARASQQERLEAQRQLMQMQIEGRRDMAQLAASMRQPPAPSLATIADPNDPNKAVVIDARTGRQIGAAPPSKSASGPLPPKALEMLQEERTAIGSTAGVNADLGALKQSIDDGKLSLGLAQNAISRGRNYLGISNENSREFATLKATLEKQRNASLLLNKGVQTEGDAVRAWNELFENLNDTKVVSKRLGEIMALNKRAAAMREMNARGILQNYGREDAMTGDYLSQPASVGAGASGTWDDAPPPGAVRLKGK